MRVREGTVTITGSPPHSRWSFCAPGHRMLSHYQAAYPALWDSATSVSLNEVVPHSTEFSGGAPSLSQAA